MMLYHHEVLKHNLTSVLAAIEIMDKDELDRFCTMLEFLGGMEVEQGAVLIEAFRKFWEVSNG